MLKNWSSDIDKEMIPYLQKLNKGKTIVTTHSCNGHNGEKSAYLSFQSNHFSASGVLGSIIEPMEWIYPNLFFSIRTTLGAYRYTIWFENSKWEEQITTLIRIVDKL